MAQSPSNEFIETELFWPRHLDGAIDWRAHGDSTDRNGDIVSRHGPDEHGCQTNLVAVGRGSGDALHEFEELRRLDDGVGDRGLLDQLLLSALRAEVPAPGQALGSHDRQRNVMPHACGHFRGKEVTPGRLEELQSRLVLRLDDAGVRRRVRHVDDDLSVL